MMRKESTNMVPRASVLGPLHDQVARSAGIEGDGLSMTGQCGHGFGIAVLELYGRCEGVDVVGARGEAVDCKGSAGRGAQNDGSDVGGGVEVRDNVDGVVRFIAGWLHIGIGGQGDLEGCAIV